MSQASAASNTNPPIETRHQLVEYLFSGCKPPEQWLIGTEHEKFGFIKKNRKPLPYEGEQGIHAMLHGLQKQFDWQPVIEDGHLIALLKDGCSITLEPGGQLELSGAPLQHLHATCNEVHTHLRQVKTIAEPLGIGFIGMGFDPLHRRDEIHWMPKQRYVIMRNHMPKVGNLGLDMMLRTCTIQVNLDFSSEADMVKKFRVGLALQPLATALFANSPFTEGKPNGYTSFRAQLWQDTDPHRTGQIPFVFDNDMGFERYVDYMLDVPMYFVKRDNKFIDAAGLSFRDFMQGKLSILPGEKPTILDWEDHLTTAFPDVRLKKFLEMRGADGGPWRKICALPAFWVGLLYHQDSLDAAWDLVKNWDMSERSALQNEVNLHGLQAKMHGKPILDIAKQILALSNQGLKARNKVDSKDQDESIFLQALAETIACGQSPAQKRLALFNEEWDQKIDPIYTEFAY